MPALDIALVLLVMHAALGAFDTFWNHELDARLPHSPGAARELALHAGRDIAFTIAFGGLAWFDWHGAWGVVLLAVLAAEYAVTVADSVVEDRTRRLSTVERINHMLLALNTGFYGVLFLVVVVSDWGLRPTALVPVDRGLISWLLTAAAAGTAAWTVRDGLAALRMRRLEAPA